MTATQTTIAAQTHNIMSTVGTGPNSLENLAAKVSAQATANAAKRQGAKPKQTKVDRKKLDASVNAFVSMGNQLKSTMVSVGGSNAEPEKEDAAKYASVTLAELSTSGSTLQSLAFNFLAGNIDKSITTDSLKDLPRALRNEKGAIVGLLGKKASGIRAAWEKEQASRKRLDRPTLRALWACVKEKKARGASETWQQKVSKILDGKQSDKMKIQMLRELVEEK